MEREVAEAFCRECRSVYENWVVCRIVFDNLPAGADLTDAAVLESPFGQCIDRVYRMCLEAWMTQVVRLDDPAEQHGNQNLSIHRIREADGWIADEHVHLDELVALLRRLPKRLKPARNRICSHNDLGTCLANATLGEFCQGEDEGYFRALAELATIVWEKWCRPSAHPLERNQVFDFDLNSLADDALSARFQAQQLRDCLCGRLREQVEQDPCGFNPGEPDGAH